MTVGEKIREIRKSKKLTQKQLGELCGIDEANIRKYELGKQNPKIETVRKIAIDGLGVTINILIDDCWSDFVPQIVEDFENSAEKANSGMQDTVNATANTILNIAETGHLNIQEYKRTFAETNERLISALLLKFDELNFEGKEKAIEYVSDLVEIKKYTT